MNNKRELVYLAGGTNNLSFYSIIDDSFLFLMNHDTVNFSYTIAPILTKNNKKYIVTCSNPAGAISGEVICSLTDSLAICQRYLDNAKIIVITDNKTLARGVSLKWQDQDKAIRVLQEFNSSVYTIKINKLNDSYQYAVNLDDYNNSPIGKGPVLVTGENLIFVNELSRIINV